MTRRTEEREEDRGAEADKTMSGRRTNQAMYRPISDCIVYFEGRHFYEPHDDEDRRRTEERPADHHFIKK